MPVDTKHPLYLNYEPDWRTMRDLYEGERQVKDKGVLYLPATAGMHLDGMGVDQPGHKAYQAYKLRAVFHDFVKEGVEALIGLLHQKPPTIELPAALEPLRENATLSGESLELLLRRINEEQLVSGRLGLIADLPANPDQSNPLPYISLYIAEAIINWDDGSSSLGADNLNLVVLDETGYERTDDFNWDLSTRYRVLQLGLLDVNEAGAATYSQGVFNDNTFNPLDMEVPLLRGTQLTRIPFVFINSKDIVAQPDSPPLLGLGQLSLAIYRGEADYRQNLYMQGQDTLVVVGGVRNPMGLPGETDAVRVGAGSRIDLDIGGDAKYVGVSSQGLAEQAKAIEADKKRAEVKAAQLINSNSSTGESGEALKTRLAAQTATLNQIALAGAAGLQSILRIIAEWVGADPLEVVVKPNVEFTNFTLDGQNYVSLMTAKGMGLPLSNESIHALLVERGVTTLEYQAELDIIANEDANRAKGAPVIEDSEGGE